MLHEMIFSGFGGQGILTMGQIVSYGAMDGGLETSWIPAYGPESRGGTSNCTMVISDQRIASPMTSSPSAIIVMNEPSFSKFVPKLKPGGICVANQDLINSETDREDIDVVWINANSAAKELGNLMTAGNICLGALNAKVGFVEHKFIEEGLGHVFTGKKTKLIALNMNAYMRGVELVGNGGG